MYPTIYRFDLSVYVCMYVYIIIYHECVVVLVGLS